MKWRKNSNLFSLVLESLNRLRRLFPVKNCSVKYLMIKKSTSSFYFVTQQSFLPFHFTLLFTYIYMVYIWYMWCFLFLFFRHCFCFIFVYYNGLVTYIVLAIKFWNSMIDAKRWLKSTRMNLIINISIQHYFCLDEINWFIYRKSWRYCDWF